MFLPPACLCPGLWEKSLQRFQDFVTTRSGQTPLQGFIRPASGGTGKQSSTPRELLSVIGSHLPLEAIYSTLKRYGTMKPLREFAQTTGEEKEELGVGEIKLTFPLRSVNIFHRESTAYGYF